MFKRISLTNKVLSLMLILAIMINLYVLNITWDSFDYLERETNSLTCDPLEIETIKEVKVYQECPECKNLDWYEVPAL